MDRESTYKFLKKNKHKTMMAKDVPEDFDLTLLIPLGDKGAFAEFDDDDEFRISDAGMDFIEQYARDYRPIIAAEEANRKANTANVIAVIALIIAILAYIKK